MDVQRDVARPHLLRISSAKPLSGCTRRSLAESDDTRGCICTICVVDLLMIGVLRSKHVEEFNPYPANVEKMVNS